LYILREFAIVFALALLACTLFMLLGIFFMKASDYAEFGVTLGQVALLAPYLMPKALAMGVPPAAMIAVTIVFGRLSAENEILAAQGGGAPIRALALPLLLCGCVLSCFSLWCNQGGLRWGYSTIRDKVLRIDDTDFFARLEKPGNSLMRPTESGSVRINWLPLVCDSQTGEKRKPIHIAYFQNQEVGRVVLARDYVAAYERGGPSGKDRIVKLTLKDARGVGERARTVEGKSNRLDMEDLKSFCKETTLEISLPQPSSIISIGDSRGERGWWDGLSQADKIAGTFAAREAFVLQRAAEFGAHAVAGSLADPAAPAFCAESWHEARISSEAASGPTGARDRALAEEAEACRKLGLSVLPFSMVVLGIGLGLLVQKSQRLIGFLLGIVVYALLYYPMMIVSKELARAGRIPVWGLFLPNLVLLALGYVLWRAYERGLLGTLPGRLAAVGAAVRDTVVVCFAAVTRPFGALQQYGAGLFSKRTDGYVAGSFAGPLLVVLLAVAALLVGLDLVEHGSDVIDGVLKAGDPLPGTLPRTGSQALLDVLVYYSIRALEMTCDLLPLLVLIAGVLCVTALVRNNEHLIYKSSGVPLQRAFRPIIWVTLLFSLAVGVLRETAMPALIMKRDYLRPLVYRHTPAPTALALPTLDYQDRQVLFQMSKYNSNSREGRNMRVYEVTDSGRMPVVLADRAFWNGHAWQLVTEPPPALPGKAHGGAAKTLAKGHAKASLPHGYLISPEALAAVGAAVQPGGDAAPARITKSPVAEWRGAVTPSFLESERLGAGVMSIPELLEASKVKPELVVELWRRLAEVVMGVFLLWMSVPFLVSESRGPVWGAGLSILFAAVYWGLNRGCIEGALQNVLPVWAPAALALLCFGVGRHLYRRMAT